MSALIAFAPRGRITGTEIPWDEIDNQTNTFGSNFVFPAYFTLSGVVSKLSVLDKCYSDSTLSRQMVNKWFVDFKSGRTNTDDAERSGQTQFWQLFQKTLKSKQNGFGRS